jgi:microcystin-dependent protein
MTRHTQLWIQSGAYSAALDRQLIGALWQGAASRGCRVTAGGGTALNIDPGIIVVPSANNTGSTLCVSDAIEALTWTPGAPAQGLVREDLIICRPRGTDLDGGVNNDWVFEAVLGAEVNANPVVPAPPAGTVAIAYVDRPGGSAAIVDADIHDQRPGGVPVSGGSPVGTMYAFPGRGTLPADHLWLDGSTDHKVSDWPDLYLVVGNDYGGDSAAGTFGLPDSRDRSIIGAGGALSPQPGSRGGSRLITVSQMPSHAHGISDPGHGHGIGDPGHAHDSNPSTAGAWGSTQGLSNYSVTAQTVFSTVFRTGGSGTGIWIGGSGTGIGIYGAGGSQPYDPPFLGALWIIKAR